LSASICNTTHSKLFKRVLKSHFYDITLTSLPKFTVDNDKCSSLSVIIKCTQLLCIFQLVLLFRERTESFHFINVGGAKNVFY